MGGKKASWRRLETLLSALLLLAAGVAVATQAHPRIVEIEPRREGDLLICRLFTAGLPGEKLSLSMQSGLVSSIELYLDLLDEKQEVRAGNHVTFQLAFDLWEEIFSVRQGGREQHFADGEAMAGFLEQLPRLPVAPVARMDPGERFRIRVGMLLNPIAPSERDRVEEVIAGKSRPATGSGDRQELSISLGKLIRFFYKDGSSRPRPQSEALSRWFRLGELDAAAEEANDEAD